MSPPSRPALTIQTPPPRFNHPPVEAALSPGEDSNELAMALALSQSESLERRLQEEKLAEKEEEDLAKALAASLLSADVLPRDAYGHDAPGTSSSRVRTGSSSSMTSQVQIAVEKIPTTDDVVLPKRNTPEAHPPDSSFLEFGRHDKWRIPVMPEHSSNAAQRKPTTSSTLEVTNDSQTSSRRLSISSASSLPYTMPSPISSSFAASGGDSEKAGMGVNQDSADVAPATEDVSQTETMVDQTVLVFDDEAYARQLAAEEEELARLESMDEKTKLHSVSAQEGPSDSLPLYSYNKLYQAQQPAPNFKLYADEEPYPLTPQTMASTTSHPISYPEVQRQNHETQINKPISEYTLNSYPSVVYPTLSKHRDTESDTHSTFSYNSSTPSSSAADRSYMRSEFESEKKSSHTSNASTPSDDNVGKEHHPVPTGMINANHFVDPELLLGVCTSCRFSSIFILTDRIISYRVFSTSNISTTHAYARSYA